MGVRTDGTPKSHTARAQWIEKDETIVLLSDCQAALEADINVDELSNTKKMREPPLDHCALKIAAAI